MGAHGEGGQGVGAGGEGAGALQYFKCAHCTMAAGFFEHRYINIHKAIHNEERKAANLNKAKQVADLKEEEAAGGKAAKKGGKGKRGKAGKKGTKGGKGSRKSAKSDKRCYN